MRKLPAMQSRAATLENSSIDEAARTAVLSFASEKPVERWFGSEILQIDDSAMNSQRVEDGLCCMLYNHDRDKVIGKVLRTWIEDGRAKAQVKFDDDDQSRKIFDKVRTGTLQGVSVGYQVNNWEEVAAGATSTSGRVAGPAYVAVRWEVCEISIVSVPADSSVGVGRSLEKEDKESNLNERMDNEMTEEKQTTVTAPAVDTEQVQAQAVEAERQRAREIRSMCHDLHIDEKTMLRYIDGGSTVEQAEKDILQQMRQQGKPSNTVKADVQRDEFDKFRAAAADALLMREGVYIKDAAAGADQLKGAGIREFMIKCIEYGGYRDNKLMFMDTDGLIRLAMTGTGALPGILSNAANKSLMKAYELANTTFQAWTARGSNKDFKAATRYRLSEAGELVQIKENGEFMYDELGEAAVQAKVLTFGRAWGITREAIINDDLGALSTIPTKYAYSARYGINKMVYKTVAEDKTLFATKNGNVGTAAALTVESLGEARKLMRTQKNIGGKQILNIQPRYLIVPAALETKAQQLLHSTADPAGNNSGVVNPFQSSLTLITDAELDQYSTTAWYLAADPAVAPAVEVTYLNGKDSPTIDSQVNFDTLGMKFRIYMDYGVNVIDYRGIVKNAGA